jgi:hypothetical protein
MVMATVVENRWVYVLITYFQYEGYKTSEPSYNQAGMMGRENAVREHE